MTVKELKAVLAEHPNAPLHIMLPDGEFVLPHFHITEVGRVHKDFIDCGGTVRSATCCMLQVWVAADTEHRLAPAKLSGILGLADRVLGSDELPVEVEYETTAVSQYPLGGVEVTPGGLLLVLGDKHTACLAPDRCGVPGAAGATGCC